MERVPVEFYSLAAQVIPVFFLLEVARVALVRAQADKQFFKVLAIRVRWEMGLTIVTEALALFVALLVVAHPDGRDGFTFFIVVFGLLLSVSGFMGALLSPLLPDKWWLATPLWFVAVVITFGGAFYIVYGN